MEKGEVFRRPGAPESLNPILRLPPHDAEGTVAGIFGDDRGGGMGKRRWIQYHRWRQRFRIQRVGADRSEGAPIEDTFCFNDDRVEGVDV